MHKKIFVAFFIFIFLSFPVFAQEKKLLDDGAGVIGNSDLEKKLNGLYEKYKTLVLVETRQKYSVDITDPKVARLLFEKHNLTSEGIPILNILILYDVDSKKLSVIYASNCGYEKEKIEEITVKLASEIENEQSKNSLWEKFFKSKKKIDEPLLNTIQSLETELGKVVEKGLVCKLEENINVKAAAVIPHADVLQDIGDIIRSHPDVDLIVTPEYSLCYMGNYDAAIKIKCGTECHVSSTTSEKSKEVVTTIRKIQEIAAKNKINFVLGTTNEIVYSNEHPELGQDVVYIVQLIINSEGRIMGARRKYANILFPNDAESKTNNDLIFDRRSDLTSIKPKTSLTGPAYDAALSTIQSYTLKNKAGQKFTIFPIICGERDILEVLTRGSGSKADILVNSEAEGDSFYEFISQYIQTGRLNKTSSQMSNEELKKFRDSLMDSTGQIQDIESYNLYLAIGSWKGAIESLFINKYVKKYNIIKEDGYFVSAEGSNLRSGIFSLEMKKLKKLEFTESYVYGEFDI